MIDNTHIQRACDPRRSVVVEACAGSGKTWLLVSRIVRLLLSGTKPHEILAITFTRKAAQEMGVRLEGVLQSFQSMDDQSLFNDLVARGMDHDDARASMVRARALAEIVLASPRTITIDTFHGWFSRINQAAPIHGGVVQGAKLREDFKRLLEESLLEWWARLGQGQGEFAELKKHFERLLGVMSVKTIQKTLNDLIAQRAAWMRFVRRAKATGSEALQQLAAQLPRFKQLDPFALALQNSKEVQRLIDVLSDLVHGGANEKRQAGFLEQGIELYQTGAPIDEVFGKFRAALLKDDDEAFAFIQEPTAALQNHCKSSGKFSFDELINIRMAWVTVLQERIDWKNQHLTYRLNEAWMALAESMLVHYAASKERMRVQDFTDIEWQSACLMEDELTSSYLQARLDAKFKHILIDEFQDTNPLQWQILEGWLSGYGEDASPPTIFMVGDPKQSIYRFRGADARLFVMVKDLLTTKFNADYLPYNTTRRNTPAVCQAVNAVFDYANRTHQYPFVEQKTLWANTHGVAESGEVVRLPLIPYEDEQIQNSDRNALEEAYRPRKKIEGSRQRYEEALRVGRMIIAYQKTRKVHDQDAGKSVLRAANWDDFLVLIRKKQYLPQIEQAFRELGLPCNSPRQGGLLKTLEGEDISALLEVLLTPTNDLAFVHVLRSPIFGVDESYIQSLSIQAQERHWWFAIRQLEDDRSKEIVQRLSLWMELAARLPVHDLLDQIYASGDIRARYAVRSPALEVPKVLANLDAFLELALDADGGRYPSLSRFIDELRRLRSGDQDEGPDEGDASDDSFDNEEMNSLDSGAIRLMTIHSAKGLEAPFVFLLDTNPRPKNKAGAGLIVDWEPKGISPNLVCAYLNKYLGGGLINALNKESEIALREDWNLLYVAMTRAKEVLVISGVAKKPSKSNPSELYDNSWYSYFDAAGVELAQSSVIESLCAGVEASVHSNIRNDKVKFTDFGQGKWQDPQAYLDQLTFVGSQANDDRDLKELGTAVHLILEHFSEIGGGQDSVVLPAANHLAVQLGIPSQLAEQARQFATNILNSQDLQNLIGNREEITSWSELDLIDQQGRLFRVDRLIEKKEELLILDYKLTIPHASSDQYASYRAQLANYKKLIARLREDKPIKTYLVDGGGRVAEVLV